MPNLSGYSKEDLAKMLQPEAKPQVAPQQPAVKEGEPQVPDKYKNPDGSINTAALLKTNLESEKVIGRQLNFENQMKQLADQNAQLQQQIQEFQQYRQEMDAKLNPPAEQQQLTAEDIANMTPQQLQSHLDQQIEAKFTAIKAEQELQQKIDQSINEVSQFDGAKELEADITKVLQSDVFQRSPSAPKMAYFAALGGKMPQLVGQARNMGYSEGYAKAKEEMTKGVDSGKSSAPVDIGQITQEQADGMSKEELAKLLPKAPMGRRYEERY
jgi:hypothetical protein